MVKDQGRSVLVRPVGGGPCPRGGWGCVGRTCASEDRRRGVRVVWRGLGPGDEGAGHDGGWGRKACGGKGVGGEQKGIAPEPGIAPGLEGTWEKMDPPHRSV